mmetsp:Transcript_42724/g.77623  ORF Transcript_42724/g.77623 Transcript_42724/m.77623 type:complete len:180 (+) Transcript_42724:21-560(+)
MCTRKMFTRLSILLLTIAGSSAFAEQSENVDGFGSDADQSHLLVRRESSWTGEDVNVVASVSPTADVSVFSEGVPGHGHAAWKKSGHTTQHMLQTEDAAPHALVEETMQSSDRSGSDASDEINPAMLSDLAYRAWDILTGTAGIIPEDYPFVCLCGADGICKGDSMKTKCPMHKGMTSG